MNKYNLKTVPSGTTFKDYDNFDYLTNGELIDINVNNIIFLNNGYTTILDLLSNLPDLTGYYTKDEIDAMVLELQGEIDNIEILSSKVIEDVKTNITDGINYELHQTTLNQQAILSLKELNYLNSQESFNGLLNTITELNTLDAPLRFDLYSTGSQTFQFVQIDKEPNTFTFLKKGKMSFIIKAEQLENTVQSSTRLVFYLYKNGENIESFTSLLPFDDKFSNTEFNGILDGDEGDVFYFTIEADNDTEDATILIKKSITFNTYFNQSLDYLVTTDNFETQIDILDEKINDNTNDITTLNSIITANFETYGRYNIMGQMLSDTAGEVRFNIVEQIPLDPAYVNVSTTPNQFINLQAGKITFNIIADGIINNEVEDLTIELKIYNNATVLDTESKVIEAGKTVSINFAGTFEVAVNDSIYASLEIVSGEGELITNNPVIIGIDFKSSTTQSAVKSSQVINDSVELPNNGINPVIVNVNNINTTKLLINNSSGSILGSTISLSDNWKNFKFLNYRIGYNIYRFVNTIPTSRINVGDKIMVYENTNLGFIIYIEFTTTTSIKFLSSNDGVITDTFRFFVLEGVNKNE